MNLSGVVRLYQPIHVVLWSLFMSYKLTVQGTVDVFVGPPLKVLIDEMGAFAFSSVNSKPFRIKTLNHIGTSDPVSKLL